MLVQTGRAWHRAAVPALGPAAVGCAYARFRAGLRVGWRRDIGLRLAKSARMFTQSNPTKHVEATLNYLKYDGSRPVVDAAQAVAGQPAIPMLPYSVLIRDARAESVPPSLDVSGFELLSHRSAMHDFADDALIRELYYAETEALLKRATGAEKVVIFDHAKRLDAPQPGSAGAPPVRGVHCDQTFKSGPRRVRDHLPPEEAEMRLRGRHAIINVWRPIGAPVYTAPLAVCDARSIALDDIVPTDFANAGKVGEVALFKPNAAHRWFYYSQMRPDEALLIKIFDSLTDGTARLSAHTAFDDPTAASDAPPRRSIEVRALVFYK